MSIADVYNNQGTGGLIGSADEPNAPEASTKRRMPDNLRRHLLDLKGKKYLPVAFRVVWFRDELGDEWGIQTELLEGGHEAGFATVKAEVLNPAGRVVSSGMKTEEKKDFMAGWVEKAESGAIGRALGFLGFGTAFSPDLDEGGRIVDSPQGTAQVEEPKHEVTPMVAALQKFRAKAAKLGYPATTNAEAAVSIVAALVQKGTLKEGDKPTVEQIETATARLAQFVSPNALMDVPPDETHAQSAVEAGL